MLLLLKFIDKLFKIRSCFKIVICVFCQLAYTERKSTRELHLM